MQNSNYVHLHLHSEKSLLDGFGSAQAYISAAKKMNFKYIAVTDHGNIDNCITWQKECYSQGVLPIIGCEAYIVEDRHVKTRGEKRGHITFWVKNQLGWKTLTEMLSEANLNGFYYRGRIDHSMLLSYDLSGLIIGTACAGSFLNTCSESFFEELLERVQVYFEIMPHDIPLQKKIHKKIKSLSKKFPNVPFLATNDCHYIAKEDVKAQEMLLAIQSRAKWKDPKRWKFGFDGLHLRTANEMIKAFATQGDFLKDIVSEAMANTIEVAKQCSDFRIEKQEISLPRVPNTQGNEEQLLIDLCVKGFKEKFGINIKDRLKKEIEKGE